MTIIPGLSADSVSTYWPDIAKKLGQGLSDNWSQVLYTLQSSHLHVYFYRCSCKVHVDVPTVTLLL